MAEELTYSGDDTYSFFQPTDTGAFCFRHNNVTVVELGDPCITNTELQAKAGLNVTGDIVFDETTNDLTLAVTDQTTGVSTVTIPDLTGVSGDMVISNSTQTLTNKTLTTPSIDQVNTATNNGDMTLNTTGSGRVVLSADPTGALHAVTKQYVDSAVNGLTVKAPVRVKTDASLPAYTQAGTGSGATLTANANGAFPSVDTVTLSINDRLLVDSTGSSSDIDNGIYTLSTVGDGSNPWILTRATDADVDAEVISGMFVYINEGLAFINTSFVITTNNPITVDTTATVFTQFSGATSINASNVGTGTGLIFKDKTGNSLNFRELTGGTGIDVTQSGDNITTAIDSTVATLSGTQTLTNKTLTTPKINDIDTASATTLLLGKSTATKVEIADTGVITEVQGNLDALGGVDVTGNITVTGTVDGVDIASHNASTTAHGATGAVVGTTNTQTLTNKTLTTPTVSGNITFDEATNDLTLAVTDQTTSASTVTVPNLGGVSGDMVVSNATQTLTSKTLTTPSIDQINTATGGGDMTLNTTASGRVVLTADPTSALHATTKQYVDTHISDTTTHGTTGAIVGTSDSQTLTNKTIDADNNTVTNIADSEIKSGAGINTTKLADGSVSNTELQYINSLSSNAQTQLDSIIASVNGHTDVNITSVADGEILKYDNGTSKWINATNNVGNDRSLFFAFDTAGNTPFSGTWTDVTLDTEIKKDAPFTHTADSAEVTITSAGWYQVTYYFGYDHTSGNEVKLTVSTKLQEDIGAGYIDMVGSEGHSYVWGNPASVGSSISATVLRQFSTNDKIKLSCIKNSGTASCTTLPNACGIYVCDATACGKGLTWQGAWVSQNYVIGDAVEYSNSSYVCKVATTANQNPLNATYWDLLATGAGETNTVSNIGTAGVNVFKQKTGSDFEMKSINTGSSKITITDDTGNNEIDVDLVEGNINILNLSGAPTGAVVGLSDTQTLTNKTLTTPKINDIDTASATTLLLGKATATKVEIADTGVVTEIQGNLDALSGVDVTGDITVTGTVDGVDVASHYASTAQHGASGAVVGTGNTQTLTNKTLITPKIDQINTNTADGNMTLNTTGVGRVVLSANPTSAMHATTKQYVDTHISDTTTHGTTGAIVGISDTQTLTNKTINSDNNTITNIVNADIKSGASIDVSKIANGTVSNTELQYLNGVTSAIQTQMDSKISHSETNLIDIENGSVGSSNHVKFCMTKSHGGSDDYNLGVDSDPVKVFFAAEDGTYRQATVFSADTASLTATIFGVSSSSNGGSSWTPRLAIQQDGKIGMGKHNPSEILDVVGNIAVSGTVDGVNVAAHNSDTTAHGATGAVVGTTNTQTLTNKTLTTPLINDIDTTSATTLFLGKATATKVEIADTGVITEVQGNLDTLGTINIGGKVCVYGTEFQEASSDGISSTTSTSFQQKLRMTTSSLPSGKYRIGYAYVLKNNGSGSSVQVQLNDSTTIHSSCGADSSCPDYFAMGGFYYADSISGVQNIDMDYKASSNTTTIKEARLEIWRIS